MSGLLTYRKFKFIKCNKKISKHSDLKIKDYGFALSIVLPPFRSSVLEPSLDLGIGHLQVFGHLCSLRARKVFLTKQSNVIRQAHNQLRPTHNTCL